MALTAPMLLTRRFDAADTTKYSCLQHHALDWKPSTSKYATNESSRCSYHASGCQESVGSHCVHRHDLLIVSKGEMCFPFYYIVPTRPTYALSTQLAVVVEAQRLQALTQTDDTRKGKYLRSLLVRKKKVTPAWVAPQPWVPWPTPGFTNNGYPRISSAPAYHAIFL